MNEVQMTLVIAYALLATLLLLVLSYGRIHWLLKVGLVVLVGACYYYSYAGWKQAQGWPSRAELPDNFLLHASVIEEPNPEKDSKGRIFIWASNLKGSIPASEPRAYELPYGKELHTSLEDALRNMRDGNVQLGGKAKKDMVEHALYRDGVGEENELKLEFTPLPDPALPGK